jgi:hypothetical protein
LQAIREFLHITKARDRTRAAVCAAVKSRRVIEFDYHGVFRTVEPFCLGVIMPGEADNESLLCYQIGGHSEYGESVGWKLFRASEIKNLEITGEEFSADRPGYDPNNLEMTTTYCCVSLGQNNESQQQESVASMPEIAKEILPYKIPQKQAASFSTHNELMRRFRFAHHVRLPELYKISWPNPSTEPLSERTKSKFKPLLRIFDQFLVLIHKWRNY